jgi:hypothetical protein
VAATPSHSPHASRPSAFRAPGWAAPPLPSSYCERSATSWRLAPFGHRSASRIFISSPAASPHQWSPETVTTSSVVGRSNPGCGLCPALSFKDLHHPCWGRGRAEPELYLPYGPAGHLLLQQGGGGLRQRGAARPQASSAPACLVRWLSWLWHSFRCHLPLPGGAWLSARRMGGCCAARTGGPPKTSRAARVAFVFLSCPALAPA